MPKAPVHKNGDLLSRKHDIRARLARDIDQAEVDPKPKTRGVKGATEI
jgi:hypothetical protein